MNLAVIFNRKIAVAALAFTFMARLSAHAHADLLAMIEGVSKRIQADPQNASDYFLRGELYRAHADWKLAEADYERAVQLNPRLEEIELARGKLFFESGRHAEARTTLDKYLANHAADVEGLITRAQVLTRLGECKSAVADLTRAIDHSPTPRPDYFLDRARLQAEQGQTAAALKGLDEGLSRLGQLVALQLCAIELECARQHYDEALKRLERLANSSVRKEKWLVRRGEILLLANRYDDAKTAFAEALAAIESLPPRLRTAPATVELRARIHQVTAAESSSKL
jgi:tetratricopeptide (TPR) repeat protein